MKTKSMDLVRIVCCCMLVVSTGCSETTVAVREVKDSISELVPDGFKAKVHSANLESARLEIADEAARIDLEVLPRYSGLIGKTTFADLRASNFDIFVQMSDGLKTCESRISHASHVACGTKTPTMTSLSTKLSTLQNRAELDLKRMQNLNAAILEMQDVSGDLEMATLELQNQTLGHQDSLADTREFVSELQRKNLANDYDAALQKELAGDMSEAEMSELSEMLASFNK